MGISFRGGVLLLFLLSCSPVEFNLTLDKRGVMLTPGESIAFTAELTGAVSKSLSWQASAGMVSEGDLSINYTAPAEPGDYTLTVSLNEMTQAQANIFVRSPGQRLGIAGNSGGVIAGPELGNAISPTEDLRKEVKASLSTPSDIFSLGKAYLLRDEANDDGLEWLVEVRNDSQKAYCFIKMAGSTLRDSAGQEVSTGDFTYVLGSVGELGTDFYTDSCLDVGELGYLMGGSAKSFQEVDSIELSAFEVDEYRVPSVPKAKIVPQDYVVINGLNISIKNEGSGPILLAHPSFPGFSTFFALDAQGAPLTSHPLVIVGWDGILDAGEQQPVYDQFFFIEGDSRYDGSAKRLRVFMDFSLSNYGFDLLSLQSFPSRDAYQAYLNTQADRLW